MPEAIDINVSNASYRKEFVLLSFLGSAYNKFVEIFVGTFFLLIELFEGKEIDFSSKLDFFFFQELFDVKNVQASNYLRWKCKQKSSQKKENNKNKKNPHVIPA